MRGSIRGIRPVSETYRGENPSPVSNALRSFDPPSPTRGEGQDDVPIASTYGVIDTGEKSTNQLFGCTKPLTFGLIARGETSWAT